MSKNIKSKKMSSNCVVINEPLNNAKSNIVIESVETPAYSLVETKDYVELKNKISRLEELVDKIQRVFSH